MIQTLAARRRLPESTYRLQFHAGFTFRDAAAIAPYLRKLGITHVYASPYLKAAAGSTHGYDIIDHCQLNPELGTQEDFDAFVQALTENELSQILDTVPNHVGVATNDNKWWNDVLEHGQTSQYGAHFDIAWKSSPRPELHGKVLLPTLGEPYGKVLESGQLQLSHDAVAGKISLNYFDRRLPVNRASFLQAAGLSDTASAEEVDDAIVKLNGKAGDSRSFDALDKLLEAQSYRLAFWRVASDEINYRRFFDINDLAALAMEREEVFEATHALIFKLLANGTLTGLRIDHPDGLHDPKQYFERLQDSFSKITKSTPSSGTPGEGRGGGPSSDAASQKTPSPTLPRSTEGGSNQGDPPLYVVAEKILAFHEPLPPDWAVHGTSGYDFLNHVNGLFINSAGEESFTRFYSDRIAPGEPDFADLVYRKKLLILDISLTSELNMLAHQLDRLAQRSRLSRDFTLSGLRLGLREMVACFGVYRTYITDAGVVTETDRKEIESATRRAIERNPKTDGSVFQFVRDVLLLNYPQSFDEEAKAAQRRFAGKFQQLTAPVTAKGIEDTAFYSYNRFVSLNEVGGDPDHFGVGPIELHRWFAERQAKYPYAMSALSTHDTKRSEDVRARLNVLSEIPSEWTAHVERWMKWNKTQRESLANDGFAPSVNDEYPLYQTLIGAWPHEPVTNDAQRETFVKRIAAYMTKAMREAKVYTSWTTPNEAYEAGVTHFIERLLDSKKSADFLEDFVPFQKKISNWGIVNSLSQTLLRIASPGVPDTYQGTELWDLSLVDPDNRRPVDYALRGRLLDVIDSESQRPSELSDPKTKLFVTARALHARRERPGLFSAGEYMPIETTGRQSDHVFAFARRQGDQLAIVAVTRFPATSAGGFSAADGQDATELQIPSFAVGRKFRNVFTDETVNVTSANLPATSLLAAFPIGLLISE